MKITEFYCCIKCFDSLLDDWHDDSLQKIWVYLCNRAVKNKGYAFTYGNKHENPDFVGLAISQLEFRRFIVTTELPQNEYADKLNIKMMGCLFSEDSLFYCTDREHHQEKEGVAKPPGDK